MFLYASTGHTGEPGICKMGTLCALLGFCMSTFTSCGIIASPTSGQSEIDQSGHYHSSRFDANGHKLQHNNKAFCLFFLFFFFGGGGGGGGWGVGGWGGGGGVTLKLLTATAIVYATPAAFLAQPPAPSCLCRSICLRKSSVAQAGMLF